MAKQIIFLITLVITLGVFAFTTYRIIRFFRFTRSAFPVKQYGKRFRLMMTVAFGQTKIFRRPGIGFLHALVFWGFCVIAAGSIEMVIDGLFGLEKSLKFLGPFYLILSASGDVFALLVGLSVVIFLIRRLFIPVKRFEGIEMKPVSHMDANLALTLILLLMISLIGMNMAYVQHTSIATETREGWYPVSQALAPVFGNIPENTLDILYEACWWIHILLIFIFANILPYSKHFHVFMSIPNVFLSRLDPIGKLANMDSITREVKLMLDPDASYEPPDENQTMERFGIKDIEDITWKNYLDALACTECGRCTSVCPANLTGKKLSPRKIMMDARARMKIKGAALIKNGNGFSDQKSLLRDYISEEELWACTTCNACAQECPVNINHPSLIIDMRRYLVMEEASAPGEIKVVFNNIENNGAPWQFSPDDRLKWANCLEMNVQ